MIKQTASDAQIDELCLSVYLHQNRWTYLYRAVDSQGQTIDFLLSAKRDVEAAKRFFRKALGQPPTVNPRTITVDKNAAYPRSALCRPTAHDTSRDRRAGIPSPAACRPCTSLPCFSKQPTSGDRN